MPRFHPKPEAMPWLTPHVMIADWEESKRFYTGAFGFTVTFELPDESGRIVHGEFGYKGQTLFMCAPDDPAYPMRSPRATGHGPSANFFVYVDDVDAFAAHAEARGAEVTRGLEDQFWGDRTVMLRDPNGHQWTFASTFKVIAPEELAPPKG